MGLLDEILRQLEEAANESRRTALPGQPRPPATRAAGDAELRARLVQKHQARPEADPEHERAEAMHRARRAAEAAAEAKAAAETARLRQASLAATDAAGLAASLRQPLTMRRLMVLNEILQPPLALRGARR